MIMDNPQHISYIQLRIGQTFLESKQVIIDPVKYHVKELNPVEKERIKFGALTHCSGYLQACKDFGILSDCMRDKLLNEYIEMERC